MTHINRLLAISLSAAAATVLLGTSADAKRADIYYAYTFYSDATYTVPVGGYREYCLNNTTIIAEQATGQQTAYVTAEPLGTCPGLGDW